MKKAFLILFPLILIASAVYFMSGDSPSEMAEEQPIKELPKAKDKVVLMDKAEPLPKVEKKPMVKIVENTGNTSPVQDKPAEFDEPEREPFEPFKENKLTDEEIEELETYFEKVEEDWDREVENLLLGELALPPQTVQDYQKLRESYDQEKIESFQEFHEYMEEKYGEGYSYTPNQDMEAFENKVLDVYQGRLRKLLGEEGYARYQEVKDAYNNKLKGEQDPEKGVMLMEF